MTEKQPAEAHSKEARAQASWVEPKASALLVLDDGTVFEGCGLGATGRAAGEVCFNTAMTGYEEILTDPSYAGQIITFTFPHIGNVGTNEDDIETVNMAATPGARGVVLHTAITQPSNYRATRHLEQWLKARGIIGLAGIDTRALTSRIRVKGMPNAVIAHEPSGKFDLDALKREAREWPGLVGMDLVPMVTGEAPQARIERATILFADMRGFRNFSGAVLNSPAKIQSYLTQFFQLLANSVLTHGG